MSSQAPVNGNAPTATVDDVTTHFGSLAFDLITLAELQAKLLYVDVKEAGSRSALAAVSLAAMGVLGLGAVSVALFGVAELLIQYAHWGRALALLVVGGAALLIAGVAGWISVGRLQKVSTIFARSHQELYANLEFIKTMVEGSNGSATKQKTWERRRF